MKNNYILAAGFFMYVSISIVVQGSVCNKFKDCICLKRVLKKVYYTNYNIEYPRRIIISLFQGDADRIKYETNGFIINSTLEAATLINKTYKLFQTKNYKINTNKKHKITSKKYLTKFKFFICDIFSGYYNNMINI